MTYCVYRLYDAHGHLLYVGHSRNVMTRIRTHRGRSWGNSIAWHTIEPHESRESALLAEQTAIGVEKPRHNYTYNPDPGPKDMRDVRFEIPDNLHTALKIRAAREGVSIKDYVMRLLAEALAEELEENGEQ